MSFTLPRVTLSSASTYIVPRSLDLSGKTCIDYRQKFVKGNPQVNSEIRYDSLTVVRAPAIGATLSSDPLLRFFDSNNNGVYDPPGSGFFVPGYASGTCMIADPVKVSPTYDPVHSGTLIGSGPWVCENTGANIAVPIGTVGTGCSSDNTSSPSATGGTYSLTRYGCTLTLTTTSCVTPASTASRTYFRSSGNLALWFWSGNLGSASHDISNISTAAFCFNKPLNTAGCTHWQQGIGAPGGRAVVGLVQISVAARFYNVGWTNPFSWTSLTGIAVGTANSFDGLPAPTLHEGANTLNPASAVGCAAIYPNGGHDF